MWHYWPQAIYLFLTILGTGVVLARHGQPKTDSYNIWTTLITDGMMLVLLYYGGFFNFLH